MVRASQQQTPMNTMKTIAGRDAIIRQTSNSSSKKAEDADALRPAQGERKSCLKS
jgi:hypothetical protein